MKNLGAMSLLMSESTPIELIINLAMVYFFTHMTQGPNGSPNQTSWIRGHLSYAESHLGPPGTPLSLPT